MEQGAAGAGGEQEMKTSQWYLQAARLAQELEVRGIRLPEDKFEARVWAIVWHDQQAWRIAKTIAARRSNRPVRMVIPMTQDGEDLLGWRTLAKINKPTYNDRVVYA